MSTQQAANMMYSCKMCPYTSSTQEAIAVHFLKQHMDVDFCSLSEPVSAASQSGTEGDPDHQAETTTTDGRPSLAPRRCSRRKGQTTKPTTAVLEGSKLLEDIGQKRLSSDLDKGGKETKSASRSRRSAMVKKQDESSAQESNDEDLGRGKRRKSTPKRYIEENDQPKEPDTEVKKGSSPARAKTSRKQDNHETKKTETNVIIQQVEGVSTEGMDYKQNVISSNVGQNQKPVAKRATSKLSKSVKESTELSLKEATSRITRKRSKMSSTSSEVETISQKIKRLPVPFLHFKKKLELMVNEWHIEQEKKREGLFQPCSFTDCGMKLTADEMKIHGSCHVQSMDGLRCPKCEFLCLHWRHMRKHLRNKHEISIERTFQCDQGNCEHKFIRSNQLRKHIMDKHFKEDLVDKILKGDVDLKEFETEEAEQQQVPTSVRKRRRDSADGTGEGRKKNKRRRVLDVDGDGDATENDHRDKVTFVCDLCLSKFRDEDAMKSHRKEHQTNQQNMLFCPDCGHICEGSEALKDHYRQEHKRKLMRHQCHSCPFATDKFYQMNAHQAIHTGQKGVMCDQCGKWLANQYNLKVHEYRKHSSEEQMTVTCSACPYKCADKSILRDHIKQHHKEMLKNPIYHKCPHCDYVGHKKQSLEFHMRIHTEQRRFKCHLCPYASKTKNHLKIHLQTHDGYHSASCPDCDFKAASKKRLSEHIMRRHLEVEPYLCKICGWRTAYSGNMWKHTKQHKKKLGDDMPDEPVDVMLELLKGTVLPEMPKAPTGKTRAQSGLGNALGDLMIHNTRADQAEICVDDLARKQNDGTAPGNEQLQVLQFSGDDVQRTYIGGSDEEIQIVQIGEDALGVTRGIGEQVVAHIQHGDSSQLPHQSSHMEIFITHDESAEKAVEVLHVREDGSIVSSTMNSDVEVAVLALAQLEPGTHTTELPTAGGDGGRITILQTVQQNQENGAEPDPSVTSVMESNIQVEPSSDKNITVADAVKTITHGHTGKSLPCDSQEPSPSEV